MKEKNDQEKQLREALLKIGEVLSSITGKDGAPVASPKGERSADGVLPPEQLGCSIKSVPPRLAKLAADTALRVNPVNGPVLGRLADLKAPTDFQPQFLTVLVSKYWGPSPRRLTVSFMEPTPADLRARIVSHMNAWTRTTCISFAETTGVGIVRISRGAGGYWSYLGTDITLIPKNRPTMNLQGFSMNTSEAEFRRVVRHETGHTLGFPHEHMRQELVSRIDPLKAYAYFLKTQGWDKATVDAQVLTSLSIQSIMGTPADQTSIMCYQLPASITKDGQPIVGGVDINSTDYTFAGKIYPKPLFGLTSELAPADQLLASVDATDWDETEDVPVTERDATLEATLILPHASNHRHPELTGAALANHA
ncbi:M12 family metallopeptidase [Hymenobacter sp. GOD-10R]|uniref:M12 family metallopeptidase n=1 Tax=Hymenobacter sp. GOD-10R TaxID=3093922 RepID=UPI002D7A396B|nr:M12 family metallopeptidase [Hymenobacter sp. GOD-10R]WRQ26198.1 M12 family metallopeptidase [Hymenobacter sp. GOD-10R]